MRRRSHDPNAGVVVDALSYWKPKPTESLMPTKGRQADALVTTTSTAMGW